MKGALNGLDLFSGIGGIGVALKQYVRTVTYCEQDRYAQGVLLSRMQSGDIDTAPIWDDVQTLTGEMLPSVDIIFGGFPCQDISVAGNGAGLAGERSGLFFEIIRLTKETKPSFIFLENVPAIRTRGLREVIRAFTEIGYDCRWTCLSAESVGANHKRERWFLLAYSDSVRKQPKQDSRQFAFSGISNSSEDVSDTNGKRLQKKRSQLQTTGIARNSYENKSWWSVEPNVGRVVNGLQNRVDRIKCLGNSVVPQQVEKAFKILMGLK